MDDSDILRRIHALVDEEHRLRAAHEDRGLHPEDRVRLADVEAQLDQLWDLLRQRRARADAGLDPGEAQPRPEPEVEGYLQ